jgi:hypothetical protein
LIPDPQFRKRDPHFDGRKGHTEKKRFTVDDFEYDETADSYKCPQGNTLTHQCRQKLRNNSGHKYRAKRGACKGCLLLEKCENRQESCKGAVCGG